MKDWEFKELVDAIDESFNSYIEEGQSSLDAGSCTIDDFWYFNKSSECVENLVIVTSTLLHLIKHQRVFIGTKKLFEKTLNSVSSNTIKSMLIEDEILSLDLMIKSVEGQMSKVELIYNPEEK